MAKKFGKFLLFTAAVGTAAAAAYYYMQQKNSLLMESTDADDDYDDFHEDLDESTEFSRNYVPLNASVPASAPTEETAETEASSSSSDFTPLSGQAADLSGEEGETVEDVEEFFDEVYTHLSPEELEEYLEENPSERKYLKRYEP
jgi:hypothetical protein